MKINTSPVRGTRDFLPTDVELREYISSKISETYKKHGFQKIETPVLENIDLLSKSEGGENLSMLFKILKRGEKLDLSNSDLKENDLVDMGLRFDLTLPLSRFYADNHAKLQTPFKSIQIGNVFRAERPQKGRYRTFVQCDIDIIGEESELAEIDLITTTTEALQSFGFKDFTIRLNDRKVLSSLITFSGFNSDDVGSVCIVLDKVDKVGVEGVKSELFAKGYEETNVDKLINVINSLENSTIDDLVKFEVPESTIKSLNNIYSIVNSKAGDNYKIVFDPFLVRGMGYYTGTIFEVSHAEFGFSIAGGGRYDKMIGKMLKEDVPAVGFSIGFERIIDILTKQNFQIPRERQKLAYIYNKKFDTNFADIIAKSDKLREDGYDVSILPAKKKLNKQLDMLQEEGYTKFCKHNDELEIKSIG